MERRRNRTTEINAANDALTHWRITYNQTWQEFRVYRKGSHVSAPDTYHTNDLDDAISTARQLDSQTDARSAR